MPKPLDAALAARMRTISAPPGQTETRGLLIERASFWANAREDQEAAVIRRFLARIVVLGAASSLSR